MPVVAVHELRHLPIEAQGQQAQRQTDRQRDGHGSVGRQPQGLRAQVQRPVTTDTLAYSSLRNSSGTSLQSTSRSTPPAQPVIMPLISTTVIGSCISCATAADDRERHRAERVRQQEDAAQAPHDRRDQGGQQRRARRHPQVFGMDHPGQRIVPQQQRRAASRRPAR